MNVRKIPSSSSTHDAPQPRVLVVDDHAQARESVAFTLRHAGYHVAGCSSAVEALKRLDRETYDVIVTDLQMPGMSGLEFIAELKRRRAPGRVIMITAYATISSAVEAMRHGAFDFLEKPFDAAALEDLVGRAVRGGGGGNGIDSSADVIDGAPQLIGDSPQMQALRLRMARAAATDETVLVCGESGTGKELVARSIHALGRRASRPFVGVNCPALSAHLMESELFGHERGAFTGAEQRRIGRFESADGGTLLLDEVMELELPLQAKLLRVLQERTFERVGSSESIRVDVRVVAATNRDLRAEVAAGRFREDLYYRLAVVPLLVPPLRERRGDVAVLLDHFFAAAASRLQCDSCRLTDDARNLLLEYRWPGNVRELQNLTTRATVLAGGERLTPQDLAPWLVEPPGVVAGAASAVLPLGLKLDELERRMIEATLARFGGHRAKTAEALGIGLRTLTTKLKTYGGGRDELPELEAA